MNSDDMNKLARMANEAILAEAADVVANNRQLCNCGTCKEAMDTAIAMYLKNEEHQCGGWMMQIAYVLIAMGKLRNMHEAQKLGMTPREAFENSQAMEQHFDRVMTSYNQIHIDQITKAMDIPPLAKPN